MSRSPTLQRIKSTCHPAYPSPRNKPSSKLCLSTYPLESSANSTSHSTPVSSWQLRSIYSKITSRWLIVYNKLELQPKWHCIFEFCEKHVDTDYNTIKMWSYCIIPRENPLRSEDIFYLWNSSTVYMYSRIFKHTKQA